MKTLASFAVVSLCVLLTSEAVAEDPMSSHEAKVRELMKLTGAEALGAQMMDGMLAQMQGNPALPEGFIEEFQRVASDNDLVDLIVPVYIEHVSEADVDAAITFYSSDAGKRLIAVQPTITAESMALGQQWGVQLGEETMRRLQAAE